MIDFGLILDHIALVVDLVVDLAPSFHLLRDHPLVLPVVVLLLYHQDHRIEMTEVVALDLWEAYEWMEETFMALHLDPTSTPDALRLRKGDEIVAVWETHLDITT